MITFKSIVEDLVIQELQKQFKETIMSAFVKWTDTDKLFKSFEGRYRLCNQIGYDKRFTGFISEIGTVTIVTK